MNVWQLFLCALKAALLGEKVNWKFEIAQKEWEELFQLANVHNVVPMIYEAVYDCESAKSMEKNFLKLIKKNCFQLVAIQAMKTQDFLHLLQTMEKNKIQLFVVKGII